jgi:hypothetical protein
LKVQEINGVHISIIDYLPTLRKQKKDVSEML